MFILFVLLVFPLVKWFVHEGTPSPDRLERALALVSRSKFRV